MIDLKNNDHQQIITKLKEQNINIVPLRPNSKLPALMWEKYQREKFDGWIPLSSNYGVICGEVSDNLVVIDIDNPSDDKIVEKIYPGALEKTLVVKTGSGGFHVYVKTIGLPKTARLSARSYRVDVQSTGTYVVGPDSTHPNGRKYEIISHTKNIARVDFKKEIQTNLEKLGIDVCKARKPIGEILQGVSEGSRNDSAFKFAAYLFDTKKFDSEIAWYELTRWNENNNPPLPGKELRITFESARKAVFGKTKQFTKTKNDKPIFKKKIKGFVDGLYLESIIVEGKPYFLCASEDGTLSIKETITTEDQTYKPFEATECGYVPYQFTSSEIVHINDSISREELFDEVKSQIDKFISLREMDKHLILANIFLTYCLEWISTIHFPFFVGETGSGKSTILHFAKWLCYRCHLGEDVPMADVYNFLGHDEEGTGTIAEDEAQELWKDKEKMRMYKGSYSKGSKKARIIGADSLGKHQVYYNTFCPKWFAGESIPRDKGFQERIAIIHMTEGIPQSNIKRLTKDQVDQLNQLRNRLLVWKLQNIQKGFEKIDSGLNNREQELWEDFVAVAYGTKYYERCKNVATYYIEQRHSVIKNSLEAKIMKLVVDSINADLELVFINFWNYMTTENGDLPGKLDEKTQRTFYPDEYLQKITYHFINALFDNKFEGKRQERVVREGGRQHKITLYSFKREVLEKLVAKYGIDLPIDHPLYVGKHGQQGQQKQDQDDQVDHGVQDGEASD